MTGEPTARHPRNGHLYVLRGNDLIEISEHREKRVGVIRDGTLELLVSYPLAVIERAADFGFSQVRVKAYALDKTISVESIERARGCDGASRKTEGYNARDNSRKS